MSDGGEVTSSSPLIQVSDITSTSSRWISPPRPENPLPDAPLQVQHISSTIPLTDRKSIEIFERLFDISY